MTRFSAYYTTETPYPPLNYAPQWWATNSQQPEMYPALPPPYSQVVDYGQGWQTRQPGSYAYPANLYYNQGPFQQLTYHEVPPATYPFPELAPHQSPMQSFPPPHPVTAFLKPYPTYSPPYAGPVPPESEIIGSEDVDEIGNIFWEVKNPPINVTYPQSQRVEDLRNKWHELVKESLSENTAQSFLDDLKSASKDKNKLNSMLSHFVNHKHSLSDDESTKILESIILASSEQFEELSLDKVKSILGITNQTPVQASPPPVAPSPPVGKATFVTPDQAAAQAPAPASAQAAPPPPPAPPEDQVGFVTLAPAAVAAKSSQPLEIQGSLRKPVQASPDPTQSQAIQIKSVATEVQGSPPQPPAAAATAQAEASQPPVATTPVLSPEHEAIIFANIAATALAEGIEPPAPALAQAPLSQENKEVLFSKSMVKRTQDGSKIEENKKQTSSILAHDKMKFKDFCEFVDQHNDSKVLEIINQGNFKTFEEFKSEVTNASSAQSTDKKISELNLSAEGKSELYSALYTNFAFKLIKSNITIPADRLGRKLKDDLGDFALFSSSKITTQDSKQRHDQCLFFSSDDKFNTLKSQFETDEFIKYFPEHPSLKIETESNPFKVNVTGSPSPSRTLCFSCSDTDKSKNGFIFLKDELQGSLNKNIKIYREGYDYTIDRSNSSLSRLTGGSKNPFSFSILRLNLEEILKKTADQSLPPPLMDRPLLPTPVVDGRPPSSTTVTAGAGVIDVGAGVQDRSSSLVGVA
jgi:hypothetical protein